jgi:hypothetical protein
MDLTNLTKGKERDINDLLTRLSEGFKRAGYHLLVRNQAWLVEGGLKARDYVNTKVGGRYRGALLVQLSRGEAVARVHLTDTSPAMFKISYGSTTKTVDHIDKGLLRDMKEIVDSQVNKHMEHIMRLLLY